MTCHPLGNGGGFFCTRERRIPPCSVCGKRLTSKLCDFALTGPRTGDTCNRKLCEGCAVNVGPNRDYCPPHARMTTALAVREPTTLATTTTKR